MVRVLIHGVPETPGLWDGVIAQLGLPAGQILTPALPGFSSPAPTGFDASKESYAGWLIDLLEVQYARTGPVDLVGHDWGALLCLRAAHLRPDLINSWAALNAVVLPGAGWHRVARLWQTPLVGEASMICARPYLMQHLLRRMGLPEATAKGLVPQIDRPMKAAILSLYRSALHVDDEWGADLSNLPKRGLLIWGEHDPFMSLDKAQRFCKKWDVPLHLEQGLGHWSLCQTPNAVARRLRQHWDGA